MKTKKILLCFFAFFVGNTLSFILVSHYLDFKGVTMSWPEIAEHWLTYVIAGVVAAAMSTIIWIAHRKDK